MSAPYDHLTRTPSGPWEGEDDQGESAKTSMPHFTGSGKLVHPLSKENSEAISKAAEPLRPMYTEQLQNIAKSVADDSALQKEYAKIAEKVLLEGDLSALTPAQRLLYYKRRCEDAGLDPMAKPMDYLRLNNKLVLYANKNATEQLRRVHGISIDIVSTKETEAGTFEVVARATDKTGRSDSSLAVVTIDGLRGDMLANAKMKAETKAKRRVTLSLTGLGMLDETEVETIPTAKKIETDPSTGDVVLPLDPYDKDAEHELVHGEKPLHVQS